MSTLEHMLPIEAHKETKAHSWQRYLLDSGLACAGAMLITAIMYLFQLYPRIPNISIVYLLVVLALASTRGRYASMLASVVAFLSFDYFLVPPLYVFTMNRLEEWIALFVFLIAAILTSQLAVALRERAEQASRRERETHILYDLVRVTNREGLPERQLHTIAQAVVDVLSPWGVHDCAILQPDATGVLHVQASAYQPAEHITFSSDEKAIATWVMKHGRAMGLYDDNLFTSTTPTTPTPSARFMQRITILSTATGHAMQHTIATPSLRLIPLKLGQKVVGVLRLHVLDDSRRLMREERLQVEQADSNTPTSFFWTFLDQVTALIERAHLQRENLRIEVLQRTDALRAALLSSVSHDLRTPLTSIKAAASSLLQQDVQWNEEARHGFALSIEREADRLNRLVGNLLDMSRIEEGALRPEKEVYSLTSLIHDVVVRLDPLLAGHTVCTHLPDDLLLVELDYLQIDQVLTNLLENAVRYTPPESPIDVNARRDGTQVVLSVADRGPGVPRADLERIFTKFYRVLHEPHTGCAGGYPLGSGLGLTVCKGLVEAHGGRVWAELRDGGGLIVFVVLPFGEGACTQVQSHPLHETSAPV